MFNKCDKIIVYATSNLSCPTRTSRRRKDLQEYLRKQIARQFEGKEYYIAKESIEEVPEKDYDFWAVSFHDASDQVIFRKDANTAEIAKMIADPDKYCKIWREFNVDSIPTHWVVWPHSISKGWCNKISRTINLK